MKKFKEREIYIRLKTLFFDKSNRPKKTPLYEAQIQRFFEKNHTPKEVSYALKQLRGKNSPYRLELWKEDVEQIGKVNFYYPQKLEKNEIQKDRVVKKIRKFSRGIIRYSSKEITGMLGKHLHQLVKVELKAQQFKIEGENTNSYNGKTASTNHTLDIIAKHKTRNLAIGVEAKNSLDLIPIKELNIKLKMCKELDIIPVFACRWLKPFYGKIQAYGGFPWEFKKQFYPLGQEKFVENLQKKFKLPVEVTPELPPEVVEKFQNWYQRFD